MDPEMEESDNAWRPDSRENMSELTHRISLFLQMLVQHPEGNIVVFTHGVFIEVCIHQYCPQALDNGRKRVYNCDMFAMDCVSRDGTFLRLDNAHQI